MRKVTCTAASGRGLSLRLLPKYDSDLFLAEVIQNTTIANTFRFILLFGVVL